MTAGMASRVTVLDGGTSRELLRVGECAITSFGGHRPRPNDVNTAEGVRPAQRSANECLDLRHVVRRLGHFGDLGGHPERGILDRRVVE